MAARDQAVFLETVIGLQRALKRRPFDSDSDSDVDHSTNRGSKLKRRARFVRQGHLGAADGLTVFTETVEHGGYRREIISHNPALIDDEGYAVDSDEDDDAVVQDAEAAAAEQNPYAGIQLEHLLAPLTAVTDLPNHPSLSRPFTNKALTELATQGSNWMHKESAALWKVKPLLIKLCGDHIWVDSGLLVTPDDADLFDDEHVARLATARGSTGPPAGLLEDRRSASRQGDTDDKDKAVGGAEPEPDPDSTMPDAGDEADTAADRRKANAPQGGAADGKQLAQSNGDRAVIPRGGGADDAGRALAGVDGGDEDADADADEEEEEEEEEGIIHPLFLAPRSARPEPNLGLPEAEAEDVRRLLQLWVQKQEEVSRGTKKLHEGLLRADRLRHTVLRWAKAEAHSGPNRDMSDGEDWYDQEEWGLEEDLKKGHDEEEEDQQLPNKKTRNRKPRPPPSSPPIVNGPASAVRRRRKRARNLLLEEIGIVDTAPLVPERGRRGIRVVVERRVDAQLDPGQEAVGRVGVVAHKDILDKGIVGRRGRKAGEEVLGIGGQGHGVGVVRRRLLDLVDQGLVEKELRNVRDGAARVRLVRRGQRGADVGGNMLVRGPAQVVAGEDGVKGDDALGIAHLDPAQERRVEAALARGGHARVGARGVAGPDVDQDRLRGQAGLHVDELQLEVHRDAGLAVGQVRPHVLAPHKIRALNVVGRQDTACVCAKDGVGGRVAVPVAEARAVVGRGVIARKVRIGTALDRVHCEWGSGVSVLFR
ncbi:hypothetical protein SPBR_02338 [Sporothrix brasiliensis 5110]|uniref:Transcriptional regulatory protein RXT2 N-terminal domain-containing protein n=1 Tax=Sporothrix brasiliensis 5110 TaxID=1398154 RepID=A0A0C2F142_9PEZI|nr:uncharacterized protein SPBR_02338 [Sporothrix brasiliensis 5110]KIH92579.1 hypothetical protein SPBR_02338 [Sporothrix brasiliensis 5110]